MSYTIEWDEVAIETVRRMWAEGASASAIGTVLGCSKNAVIGKAHRLKLPARASPIKMQARTDKTPRAVADIPPPLPAPIVVAPPTQANRTKIAAKLWSAEEEAILRRLSAAGMTHRAIGARLGKSIDAVERRCRKLGIKSKLCVRRTGRRTAPVNPIGPKPPPKNANVIALMGAVARDRQRRGIKPIRKAIKTFPAPRCQYPVSKDRPWRFCERPSRDAGTSYCAEHHDLCFVVYTRREAA